MDSAEFVPEEPPSPDALVAQQKQDVSLGRRRLLTGLLRGLVEELDNGRVVPAFEMRVGDETFPRHGLFALASPVGPVIRVEVRVSEARIAQFLEDGWQLTDSA